MGDYDLQIMVSLVIASTLFSGFMFQYAQQPTIDFNEPEYIILNKTSDPDVEPEQVGFLKWLYHLFFDEHTEYLEYADEEELKKVRDKNAIANVFLLIDSFQKTEIWIVGLFTTAMSIIGGIIVLRFIRGQ